MRERDVVVDACPHRERPYEALITRVEREGRTRWKVQTSYRDGCGGVTLAAERPERVVTRGGAVVPHRFLLRI